MGIDEAGHQQERAQRFGIACAAPCIAVFQPGDDAVGDQRVTPDTGVGQQRAVRLRADPPRKPERRKRIRVQVALHGGVVDDAVVVVGRQRSAGGRVGEVRVRDVPFPVVVGVVSRRAEPVAQRGHLAPAEPPHAGVVIGLADAVGLGDAVQVGVVPGEDRRAAGHAGQRAGVMPAETDAVLVEPLAACQRPVAPCEHLGRLVRRNRALLVGHQDDDVGEVRHVCSPFVSRGRPASRRTAWPAPGTTRAPPVAGLSENRFRPCSSASPRSNRLPASTSSGS